MKAKGLTFDRKPMLMSDVMKEIRKYTSLQRNKGRFLATKSRSPQKKLSTLQMTNKQTVASIYSQV